MTSYMIVMWIAAAVTVVCAVASIRYAATARRNALRATLAARRAQNSLDRGYRGQTVTRDDGVQVMLKDDGSVVYFAPGGAGGTNGGDGQPGSGIGGGAGGTGGGWFPVRDPE